MDDMQLLRDYAETGSEQAFAEIVSRHLGWVYAVCLRGVRDRHLAEDVAQAVFVLLARKASQISGNVILRGWLFKTSRFAVADALKKRSREKRRLVPFAELSESHLTAQEEMAWEQVAPVLDEAISCLKSDDRQAILLRFFENLSLAEVGQRLGVSEEAAKKRVSRAVEKLRGILSRQGVCATSAMLLGLLLVRSSVAMPTGLTESVQVIGASEMAASHSAAGIADGAATAMVQAARRLLLAISAGVAAALLALIGCVSMCAGPSTAGQTAQQAVSASPASMQLDLDRVQRIVVGTRDQILLQYRQGEGIQWNEAVVASGDTDTFAVLIDDGDRAWTRQLRLSPISLACRDRDVPVWTDVRSLLALTAPDPRDALTMLLGDAPAGLADSLDTRAMPSALVSGPLSGPAPGNDRADGWSALPSHRDGGNLIVDQSPIPLEKLYQQIWPQDFQTQPEYALVPEPGVVLAGLVAVGTLMTRPRRHTST